MRDSKTNGLWGSPKLYNIPEVGSLNLSPFREILIYSSPGPVGATLPPHLTQLPDYFKRKLPKIMEESFWTARVDLCFTTVYLFRTFTNVTLNYFPSSGFTDSPLDHMVNSYNVASLLWV